MTPAQPMHRRKWQNDAELRHPVGSWAAPGSIMRRYSRALRSSSLIVILFGWSSLYFAAAAATDDTPWPTNGWMRAQPADQGLDAKRLQKLVKRIRDGELPDIHSLLIVRNGHLLVEEYFGDHQADELHTLQSVSKSFTSALVGIAIEKGQFPGVDPSGDRLRRFPTRVSHLSRSLQCGVCWEDLKCWRGRLTTG